VTTAVIVTITPMADRDKFSILEVKLADAKRTPLVKLQIPTRELRVSLEPQQNNFSTVPGELIR
jgi:hypothetical protein